MQSIQEIQNSIIHAYNGIDDKLMQYEFLLQIGAELESFPAEKKDDGHLISDCQSKLWLAFSIQNGRIHIWADSEALIVKGITAIAVFMFQDQLAQEVANADITYLEETDMRSQINTDRFKGIYGAIASIQRYAAENCQER